MMSSVWGYKSLEDVCSLITDGSHFSPKTSSIGDFPYITVRDIRGTDVDFSKCQFVNEVAFKELQKTGCQPELGDVLFSKDGTVGKVAIVKDSRPFVVLSSLAILRPNPDLVTPGFLAYVLQSPTVLENALGMKTGTAIRRVVLRNLKKLVFPLPPLDEQKRIVEVLEDHLSRLDKARAKIAIARGKLFILERAVLHDSLTSIANESEVVDFSDFFAVVQPRFEGYKQRDYQSKGVLPIVDQGRALVGGYISETTRRHSVQKPLVIFGDHTRCVKFIDFDFALGADGTKMLEPQEGVDSKFAYWQLRGKELRNRGYARHMGELRKERFWLPGFKTQQEMSQRVEKAFDYVNRLRSDLENQEKALEALRRSLLHSTFSGEKEGSKADE